MMAALDLLFIFLTLAACSWALVQERQRGEQLRLSGRAYRYILLAVCVLAVAVRVWRFGQVPGGMNQDGAMAAIDGKALADYGTDHYGMPWPVHLTAWGYGQMSALLSYLIAPLVKLFGLSITAARLPQLIVSLLGLAALYLFCRKAFGKAAALAALALGAFSPWHILQSRWALDCDLLPHFFLFGLCFLLYGLEGERRSWKLAASMLCFGLCMYCYGITIYTLPFFLLISCAYLLATKRVSWGQALLCAGGYLAVSWPFILTMAVNTFGWDSIYTPFFTIPYFPGSLRAGDILFFSSRPLEQLWLNLKSLFQLLLLQDDGLPWNCIPAFGTVYLFSLPFALLGLYHLARKWREPGAALTLASFLTGIWCGLCTNWVNINRLNIIFYPVIILAALGICACIRGRAKKYIALGLSMMYMFSFFAFSRCYFTDYARAMEQYFMADFGQALTYLKDSPAERLYITAHSQAEGTDYVSEVLTLFYHQIDAQYFQGEAELEGLLPYKERYSYPKLPKPMGEGGRAYLLHETELWAFDLSEYKLSIFGNYYVLEDKP